MKIYPNANPPYIEAEADVVLCNGVSRTSLGGRVYSNDLATAETDWTEMTEAEADAIIAAHSDEEVTGDEFLDMVEEVL